MTAIATKFMLEPTPEVDQPSSEGECTLTLRDLFDSEETPLLRYAFSLTGRRAVAEEIVQEVFLQLHGRFDEVASPRAWLFRSVRNKAFDYHRNHRREVFVAEQPDSPAGDESPESLVVRMEAMGVLRLAMRELSETDQQLIRLKYFENLKYSEISAQSGLGMGNVGYRLHHILKELSARLQRMGVDAAS
ncbi:RNA polymerase sigma factor [Allorhodopirellula heiligendammensis]|uniref:ECF RNA polymerase sigma factor SigL n=1 Tax=Allorhodopirellula heiligendammensis TaxID=2714739 RepID=A0A5C6BVH9_9BACT|nr:sigma-70 family RNA polymerase sigma factor [Allorhodopirellula heiligendammensis]TWU15226.1 ECF RNA polymerase sigma factor SigL [Allorhodopirellula heiligendammensis]